MRNTLIATAWIFAFLFCQQANAGDIDAPDNIQKYCEEIDNDSTKHSRKAQIIDEGALMPIVIYKNSKGEIEKISLRPDNSEGRTKQTDRQPEDFCYNFAGALAAHFFPIENDQRIFMGNSLIRWTVKNERKKSSDSRWRTTEGESVKRAHELYYKALKAKSSKSQ